MIFVFDTFAFWLIFSWVYRLFRWNKEESPLFKYFLRYLICLPAICVLIMIGVCTDKDFKITDIW